MEIRLLQEIPQLFRAAHRCVRYVHPAPKSVSARIINAMQINQTGRTVFPDTSSPAHLWGSPCARRKNLRNLVLSITSVPRAPARRSIKNSSADAERSFPPASGPGLTTMPRGSSLTWFSDRGTFSGSLRSCAQPCAQESEASSHRSALISSLIPPAVSYHIPRFAAKKNLAARPLARRPHRISLVVCASLYFGASSFFSASANSLGHNPNAFQHPIFMLRDQHLAVRSWAKATANRSGRPRSRTPPAP